MLNSKSVRWLVFLAVFFVVTKDSYAQNILSSGHCESLYNKENRLDYPNPKKINVYLMSSFAQRYKSCHEHTINTNLPSRVEYSQEIA